MLYRDVKPQMLRSSGFSSNCVGITGTWYLRGTVSSQNSYEILTSNVMVLKGVPLGGDEVMSAEPP